MSVTSWNKVSKTFKEKATVDTYSNAIWETTVLKTATPQYLSERMALEELVHQDKVTGCQNGNNEHIPPIQAYPSPSHSA
eukprot:snap_masked-scaffold_36-processed-gene-1.44-mRNA-1 protein AED:1.00 eAED:1.00 QI:0/-1/0/0/-1/1/1/0/79